MRITNTTPGQITINYRNGVAVPVPAGGYNFASIVTHETGHFLGMAHSGDPYAVMYSQYRPGTTSLRYLTQDDVSGICVVVVATSANGARAAPATLDVAFDDASALDDDDTATAASVVRGS